MPRTVSQKMMLKPGMRAHFIDMPEAARESMNLPDLNETDRLTGEFDYLHIFCVHEKELAARFPRLKQHLRTTGALWVSWPKARQLDTDLTLHNVVQVGYANGLVESTCISINEVWSALRFTHPKPGKTYRNSHAELSLGEGDAP